MKKEKLKNRYMFPDFLAKSMAKVDQRTQFEASMMSMSLMMVGLLASNIYVWIYGAFPVWFKITITVNSFFGLIFMWSYVVTTFQQYQGFMTALEFQLKGGK